MPTITLDTSQLRAKMARLDRQVPFAAARALNDVALAFQAGERQGLQQRMTIRRQWVLRGVKINRGDFATKRKLHVTVQIDPTRGFLGKFERGDPKIPRGRSLAIPQVGSAAKRTQASVTPKALRPRSLAFHQVGGRHLVSASSRLTTLRGGVLRGALRVYEGQRRTLLIQIPQGTGVILQRRGRGKGSTLQALYVLRPRARTPDSLQFVRTAHAWAARLWAPALWRRWREAMRTARP